MVWNIKSIKKKIFIKLMAKLDQVRIGLKVSTFNYLLTNMQLFCTFTFSSCFNWIFIFLVCFIVFILGQSLMNCFLHYFTSSFLILFDKLSSKTTFEYDYFVVILKMTGTFELGFDNNTKSFPMNDYWVPLDV